MGSQLNSLLQSVNVHGSKVTNELIGDYYKIIFSLRIKTAIASLLGINLCAKLKPYNIYEAKFANKQWRFDWCSYKINT